MGLLHAMYAILVDKKCHFTLLHQKLSGLNFPITPSKDELQLGVNCRQRITDNVVSVRYDPLIL